MSETRSCTEFLRRICNSLVEDGGFAMAWIGWRDSKSGAVAPIAQAGDPLRYAGWLKGISREDADQVWNDCQTTPSLPLPPEDTGVQAAVAFPIRRRDGADCGLLCLYSRDVNFFGTKEAGMLSTVALNISRGLDHLDGEARLEAEFGYERDLLQALMENSLERIYFKDLASRFVRCSKAMCDHRGITPLEIIGKSDADFFEEKHARDVFEDEQNIIRTGQPIVGKVEKHIWKEKEESWGLTTKMPLRNKAGEIIGTFGISKDVTAIKQAEAKVEKLHKQLLQTSRLAGMTEVATSVLHNVGNVLNSVNISSSLVREKVRTSKVLNLGKVATLLQEHAADVPGFFASDPKGKQLPGYLADLARHLAVEREEILHELASLTGNIEHIKEIVSMQQNYARISGVVESLSISDLLEDAIQINAGAMVRHHVQIVREFAEMPAVTVDKHKVLQILVNLLHNAKYALDEITSGDRQIILRVEPRENDRVAISVIDNGIGIPAGNLPRIFEHGFTTRKNGHGFGLHSSALATNDLGGTLTAHSDGHGKGATFTLEIPCQPPKSSV